MSRASELLEKLGEGSTEAAKAFKAAGVSGKSVSDKPKTEEKYMALWKILSDKTKWKSEAGDKEYRSTFTSIIDGSTIDANARNAAGYSELGYF